MQPTTATYITLRRLLTPATSALASARAVARFSGAAVLRVTRGGRQVVWRTSLHGTDILFVATTTPTRSPRPWRDFGEARYGRLTAERTKGAYRVTRRMWLVSTEPLQEMYRHLLKSKYGRARSADMVREMTRRVVSRVRAYSRWHFIAIDTLAVTLSGKVVGQWTDDGYESDIRDDDLMMVLADLLDSYKQEVMAANRL